MIALGRAAVALGLCALAGGLTRDARAQWGIALEVPRTTYGNTSRDTSANGPGGSFRPAKTLAVSLRVDRQMGRLAASMGVRVASAGLVLDAPDIFVGIGGKIKSLELLPEIRWRLARTGRGATLDLYGGPVIGLWDFEDFGERWISGATAGALGAFPIFDRLTLSLRIGGSLLHCVFKDGELPPVFVLHATRRGEIALGLRYGR
jgi:hypothetical protein